MNIEQLREKYAPLFYQLVMRCAPRKPDLGVEVLSRKAEERAHKNQIPTEEAYRQIYQEACARVQKRVELMQACGIKKSSNVRR